MKFKVLEVNDYTHSYKDKDVYTSWQLNEIKNRVRKNPSRMTFDPVEAYFQNLYWYWEKDRRDQIIMTIYITVTVVLCIVAIWLGVVT
tara:strand:- start:571 stop:834 length:264 start_codon:yes stop_codon:yes gene_type:complete